MDDELDLLRGLLDDFIIGAMGFHGYNEYKVDNMKMHLNVLRGKTLLNNALSDLAEHGVQRELNASELSVLTDSLEEQRRELGVAAGKYVMKQSAFRTAILNVEGRLSKFAQDSNLTISIIELQALLERVKTLHNKQMELTATANADLIDHKKHLEEQRQKSGPAPDDDEVDEKLEKKMSLINIMRDMILNGLTYMPFVLGDEAYIKLQEDLRCPANLDNLHEMYHCIVQRQQQRLSQENEQPDEDEASD